MANVIEDNKLSGVTTDPDTGISLEVIGISSVNREEWLVTDLACNLLGVTSVPLYETLGQEMLNIILDECELTTIFGSDICLRNILSISKSNYKLQKLVTFDSEISAELIFFVIPVVFSVSAKLIYLNKDCKENNSFRMKNH